VCKKVGHIEAKCVSNVFKCSKFGETHDAKLNCKPEKLKCSNCCGEHSCFYRGCPHFKEMRIRQLNEINQKNIKKTEKINGKIQLASTETKRAYSAAVTRNETTFYNHKEINEKLDNLLAITITKDEL
jgi:hypothetical protein